MAGPISTTSSFSGIVTLSEPERRIDVHTYSWLISALRQPAYPAWGIVRSPDDDEVVLAETHAVSIATNSRLVLARPATTLLGKTLKLARLTRLKLPNAPENRPDFLEVAPTVGLGFDDGQEEVLHAAMASEGPSCVENLPHLR